MPSGGSENRSVPTTLEGRAIARPDTDRARRRRDPFHQLIQLWIRRVEPRHVREASRVPRHSVLDESVVVASHATGQHMRFRWRDVDDRAFHPYGVHGRDGLLHFASDMDLGIDNVERRGLPLGTDRGHVSGVPHDRPILA